MFSRINGHSAYYSQHFCGNYTSPRFSLWIWQSWIYRMDNGTSTSEIASRWQNILQSLIFLFHIDFRLLIGFDFEVITRSGHQTIKFNWVQTKSLLWYSTSGKIFLGNMVISRKLGWAPTPSANRRWICDHWKNTHSFWTQNLVKDRKGRRHYSNLSMGNGFRWL